MSLWERQQRSARAWAAELPRACAMCVGLVLSPWGRVVHGVCKAILQLWGRGVGALANPLLIAKSHRHVCGSLGTCGTPGCPQLPPHRLLGSWGVQGTGEHSPRQLCKLLVCPVLKPCSMSCCCTSLLHFSAGSATQRARGCGDSPLLLESQVREGTGQGPGEETGHGSTCGHLPAPQAEVVGPPGRGEGTPSPGDAAGATWPPPCAPRGS